MIINLDGTPNPLPDLNGSVNDNTTVVDLENPTPEFVASTDTPDIEVDLTNPPSGSVTTSGPDVLEPLFPSQIELTGLGNLPDVDMTGIENHSLLIYDEPNQTWKTTRTIEHHFVNGGQY